MVLKRLVLASKNKGKVREIADILSGLNMEIYSLERYDTIPDIEETGSTFFENAYAKAKTVSELTGEIVVADDSGLEVDSLGGQPGVRSSRYAGEYATDPENIMKLLRAMEGIPREQRGATFRCVLVLYWPDGKYEVFEGSLRGVIHDRPVGTGGFGYDPVFFLPDKGVTVAQLSPEEKNAISHRGCAARKLKDFLTQHVSK